MDRTLKEPVVSRAALLIWKVHYKSKHWGWRCKRIEKIVKIVERSTWNKAVETCAQDILSDGIQLHPELSAQLRRLKK